MKRLLIAFCLIISFPLHARKFTRVLIPGATCGDGTTYSVFVNSTGKDARKLAVEFMGGGVCWDSSSCFGPNLRTWIHPLPKLIGQTNVMVSETEKKSPLHNHMVLYFPYCAGDVFAGSHTIKYEWGPKVHHTGHSNIEKSLVHLQNSGYINLDSVQDLVLYGSSAGGIASLLHSATFDKYISRKTKRTILADAPGLHFGKTFWNKFTRQQLRDFNTAFSKVGLNSVMDDGMVANRAPDFCRALRKWEIGILQGSQDLIMSSVFGNITPEEHRQLVYSDSGIFELTKSIKNCSAWTPDTLMHTFLLTTFSAAIQTSDEVSAREFARRIYERRNAGRSYR